MATYGESTVATYKAVLSTTGKGVTGDAANHTLRWIKDGTSAAPTNTPTEVDATNAPGTYKITMTASECEALMGTLTGASSTSNVVIIDVQVSFIRALSIAVAPIQATVIRPQLTTLGGLRRDLSMVQHTSGAFVFVITDGDGEPVSQAGESIEFVIFSEATGQVIASHTVGSGIAIAGDDNNQITVTVAEASTAASGAYKYVLRNTTRGAAHAYGAFDIITAPTAQ